MRRIAIVLAGGLLALAAGCSAEDIAEEAAERATGGDVDLETSGDVPDCFPDDVPVPDGSIQGGVGVDQGDTAVCTFIVDVDGTTADVLADYRSELEDAGFTVQTELAQPGQEFFGVTKGDIGILVAAQQIGGSTSLSISSGTTDVVGGTAPPG